MGRAVVFPELVYARPMSRPARPSPNELAPGWPNLKSSDQVGEIARLFAANLKAAIGDNSLRAIALRTGVDHSTIQSILQGRVWPDVYTLAKLEIGLDADLWPSRAHRK